MLIASVGISGEYVSFIKTSLISLFMQFNFEFSNTVIRNHNQSYKLSLIIPNAGGGE